MNNFFYPSIDVKESGRRIDQVRKERNFSVKDLQIYFGFSAPQAIYKWLSGQSLPSTDHLLALSFLFQTPMSELLVYNTIELNYSPREDSRVFCFSDELNSLLKCLFNKNLWKQSVEGFLPYLIS